mgnify:FL=1|tara:strand:- start:1844 stop:2563 length:720 start_codon:yes stop_codon:yes gene_type:complete
MAYIPLATEAFINNLNDINFSVQVRDLLYCNPINSQSLGNFTVYNTTKLIGEITEINQGTSHVCSITGVQHSSGAADDGRYFFFEVQDMNNVLSQNYVNATIYNISHYRNNQLIYTGPVKLWNQTSINSGGSSPSGGSTKGHGRYAPYSTSAPGDWQVGDVITVDASIGFNYTSQGLTSTQVESTFALSPQSFITFKKSLSANSNSLKGYFALCNFVNNDFSNKNELFSVNSQIAFSSK